jgi:hypothetical protein
MNRCGLGPLRCCGRYAVSIPSAGDGPVTDGDGVQVLNESARTAAGGEVVWETFADGPRKIVTTGCTGAAACPCFEVYGSGAAAP